jgi:hypothetical protein
MQVLISATSIGGSAGPFTITDNLSNTVATGITRSQILSGYTATVNNSASSITLTSSGACTNSTTISISGGAVFQYGADGWSGYLTVINGSTVLYSSPYSEGDLYIYPSISTRVPNGSTIYMQVTQTTVDCAISYYINGTYQTTYYATYDSEFLDYNVYTPTLYAYTGNTYLLFQEII